MNYIFHKQFPINFTEQTGYKENAEEHFEKNAEVWCRLKWFSYESNGYQMRKIVETCMRLNPRSRAIVLFTYREPFSRLVSLVNQICNKVIGRRSVEMQSFCKRCDCRESNSTMLKEYIALTNEMYLSVLSITQVNLNNVKVMALDILELSEFLNALNLEPSFTHFDTSSIVKNPEETQSCNFCITSEIMRELAPSMGVYRDLTRFRV